MSAAEEEHLSHWGWGLASRFPDRDTRKAMAAQAAPLLGFAAPTLEDPVAIDAITLSPSRVSPPAALTALIDTSPESRIRHTYGRSYRDILRGMRGDYGGAPDAVAWPREEADISAILDWAGAAGLAVVPYGGGTSVVGGVEPAPRADQQGAISLDLRHLGGLLEVDRLSLAARIQAGARGPAIERALADHGLTLRHFPQSFEYSTLGGWIATRAGGHFATLYTHIDDLVESTRMVTPRGVLETRRLPASGAGPSPDRLVLGSEGTLGIITEAWMRVRQRPGCRATATFTFAKFQDAIAAVRALSQSGLYPTNCRLLDKREAALNMVVQNGRHVLIVGFEADDRDLAPAMAAAASLAAASGGTLHDGPHFRGRTRATDSSASAAQGWRQAFIDAPYLLNILASVGVIADTFETACTWQNFAAMHADIHERGRALIREVCGDGVLSCRLTHVYPDGPAPYYTFIAKGRVGSELAQWSALKAGFSELLLDHGATITHHHGVGRVHRPYYHRQADPLFLRALGAIKAEFDPEGVLNPGVLLPDRHTATASR